MPESTIITALAGDAEIEAGSRSGPAKGKKKLIVSFETPLAGNGSLPQEIDGFLAALRADATLKRHFPLIEVSGFRANPARAGRTSVGNLQRRLSAAGREREEIGSRRTEPAEGGRECGRIGQLTTETTDNHESESCESRPAAS